MRKSISAAEREDENGGLTVRALGSLHRALHRTSTGWWGRTVILIVGRGISDASGVRHSSERSYNHYVNGIREPNLITLVRIAGVLQTTPDDLLGVSKPEEVSARSRLMARLVSAAQVLADEVLEIVVVQAEALTTSRRMKPSEPKAD